MILILGVKGQLGKALAALLDRHGRGYSGLDRPEFDIVSFEAVRTVVGEVRPELVINCAAFTDVDGAEQRPAEALGVNALGVRNLAVACGEKGIPLVHISTDFVFDGEKRTPYTIADEPRPINEYGRGKLLGERLLTSLTDQYYLVRTSWLFGRGEQNFLAKLLGWAARNETLRVVDDQVASPTAAEDLAAAILKLATTGAFGIYHYRNDGQCSRFDWAKYTLEKHGWRGKLEPVPSNFFPTPARRPAYSVLDVYPINNMGIDMPHWQLATERWLEERK